MPRRMRTKINNLTETPKHAKKLPRDTLKFPTFSEHQIRCRFVLVMGLFFISQKKSTRGKWPLPFLLLSLSFGKSNCKTIRKDAKVPWP